ncbi:MAG: hypothetical protein WAV07_06910 [Candidatus Contendobacter sp.]
MIQPSSDIAPQAQTQAALDAMYAYFTATAKARPRLERQRLAHEWLAAVRRLRVTIQ